MVKKTAQYVCQACGATSSKWAGQCESCGSWNTFTEEAAPSSLPKGTTAGVEGRTITLTSLTGHAEHPPRLPTGIGELDRVCGGGLVQGMAILVGGDPGIGKSTILLQACAHLAANNVTCVYISGEESVDQVRLRAHRLGLSKSPVQLAAASNTRDLIATLNQSKPQVVVIDSIQTMYTDVLDSAPGTVSQVRAASYEFIRLAKEKNMALFLVGHVTKEGTIAGPRVIEHMVDTVLYFEGERGHHFRILRAVKNRFGPTDEIGVFEMTEKGLCEVSNPSALFLAERRGNVSGSAVFAGIEGTRPMLLEIQALITSSGGSPSKRVVVGWDHQRLATLIAVLEARCGVALGGHDIFLNVAGGLKVSEPAADLAVAAALISAKFNQPTPPKMVLFGEIGLSGEIRRVTLMEQRLKEAEKLGFETALVPKRPQGKSHLTFPALQVQEIGHLSDMVEMLKKG